MSIYPEKRVIISPVGLGIMIGFFFSWLIYYPFYGEIFFLKHGLVNLPVGHFFVLSSVVTLIVCSRWCRPAFFFTPLLPYFAAASLILLNALTLLLPLPLPLLYILFSLLGINLALLLLLFIPLFVLQEKPLNCLAAIFLSHVFGYLILETLPGDYIKITLIIGLSAIPLILLRYPVSGAVDKKDSSLNICDFLRTTENLEINFINPVSRRGVLLYLLTFTALVFLNILVETVLYFNVIEMMEISRLHLVFLYLGVYSTTILTFVASLQRFRQPALVGLCLSLMGVGLTLYALDAHHSQAVTLSFYLLTAGTAGITLIFSISLWNLFPYLGFRRTFAFAFAIYFFCTMLIAMVYSWGFLQQLGRDPVTNTVFISALFLIVPLILHPGTSPFFRFPFPRHTRENTVATENIFTREMLERDRISALLSPAESKVFLQLCQGCTDKEIAAALFISPNTVKYHTRNILHKTGVKNRYELLTRLDLNKSSDSKKQEKPVNRPQKTELKTQNSGLKIQKKEKKQ